MSTRPVVIVSQCLGFAAVRYNGAIIHDEFVRRLAEAVDIIEVCPEVGIGLGVPRAPIRMQTAQDSGAPHTRLIQPAHNRDITADMMSYATRFLEQLPHVDGFILKSRSPSCGLAGVSVYDGDSDAIVATRAGMFAHAVRERFPELPATDEIALRDVEHRRDFLTRIFARYRMQSDLQPFPGDLL